MARRALTWNERMACRRLARLKWNAQGEFYSCPHNDAILLAVWILTLGRNPAEFSRWVLGLDEA